MFKIIFFEGKNLRNDFNCNTPQVEVEYISAYRVYPLHCTIVGTKRSNSDHIIIKAKLPRCNSK